MSRNLLRLSAAANRSAAIKDFFFIYYQLRSLGHNPTIKWWDKWGGARKIDKETRSLIQWAQEKEIEITLPEGWKP